MRLTSLGAVVNTVPIESAEALPGGMTATHNMWEEAAAAVRCDK